MLQKLAALLPLLGWFYLSIIGIVLFHWLTRGKLQFILKIIYLGFAFYALLICFRSLKDELVLHWEAKKFLKDSFEDKIMRDKGMYYTVYYRNLRPRMQSIELLNFLDPYSSRSRELHYARLYLYPTDVIPIKTIEERKAPYILIDVENSEVLQPFKDVENCGDNKFILKIPEK